MTTTQITAHGAGQTVLGVWSTTYSSSNITDAALVPGSTFTIGVNATNVPRIENQSTGGINGFDITLRFDSTVLNATAVAFNAPLCPASDGCLFDKSQAFRLDIEVNSTGFVRVAAVLFGTVVDGSGILFRATFKVLHAGSTSLHISPDSQLPGPVNQQIVLVPYTPQDGSFNSSSANAPPVARFAFQPANPSVASQVSFDGSQSYDSDGSIAGYVWNFGDGNSAQGSQVVHSFANPGNYSVTLTVMDNQGAQGVQVQVVRVLNTGPSGSNSGTSAFPSLTSSGPFIVAGLVLVAIIVALAYVRRGRRK